MYYKCLLDELNPIIESAFKKYKQSIISLEEMRDSKKIGEKSFEGPAIKAQKDKVRKYEEKLNRLTDIAVNLQQLSVFNGEQGSFKKGSNK